MSTRRRTDPFSREHWLGRALTGFTGIVLRLAPLLLLLTLALTVAAGWFTARNIGINTDTTDMISAELDWRQDFIEFREAFPILWRSLIVVIDGDSADLAEGARQALLDEVLAREDLFVFQEGERAETFFARQGLLYQSTAELQQLADRLAQIQPFLGRLARDPTLRGFADMFTLVARAAEEGGDLDATPLLRELAAALEAVNEDRFHRFPWLELMDADGEVDAADRRRLILLQPRLDESRVAPAREVIEFLYGAADRLDLDAAHGVQVRLTGPVALEYEELRSVSRGASMAAVLTLVLVLAVLSWGLRSPALVTAALVTLISGLVLTAAFAAYAVGKLNLISVAFAVLYIGLGIDFSVHYCLRFRELLRLGMQRQQAIRTTAGDVGASLAFCAVTTSIGFYAFVPTDFTGVSELGLISGTGMFISLGANLIVLPALLRVLPLGRMGRLGAPAGAVAASAAGAAGDASGPERSHAAASQGGTGRDGAPSAAAGGAATPLRPPLPMRLPRIVLGVAALLGVVAVASLWLVRFDPNPLNLRDQQSPSVTAYRDLLEQPSTSPLVLSVLEPDRAGAAAAAARGEALPLVDDGRSILTFVPDAQQERLALIEEIAFIIGPDLALGEAEALDRNQYEQALRDLQAALTDLASRQQSDDATLAERALDALNGFRDDLADVAAQAAEMARLETLESTLLAGFAPQLARLETALAARPFGAGDLPQDLRSRWIAPDGRYRVEFTPAENLNDNTAMARFVNAVGGAFPEATGLPVVQLRAGRAVVQAFLQAIGSALVLITLLLLVLMRSARATVQVMGPVLLASLFTAAATVALGIEFNFANIIALPLLLGMGVDNGIHLVHRYHAAPPGDGNLLATSTARAVVFSALTTIVSFASLAVSEHPGTASMGVVLATGLLLILACTLLVLPALLQLGPPPAAHRERHA